MKSIVLRPRTRLLSIRVTREEHEKLRNIAATRGARCLSDFARGALLQVASGLEAGTAPCDPAPATSAFEKRIQAVEVQLALLMQRVESAEDPDQFHLTGNSA